MMDGGKNSSAINPSSSTVASTLGGSAAVIIIYSLHAIWKVDFPAGMEAAIASFITALSGYIPKTGRSV